jgi:SPP1 family phage portal protein
MPDGFWVKSIIDAIEMLRSRNCDELWDTIQQLLAIKGYLGNDVTVLQENFRRYGMVMLHADGGMDSVKNEIQYSALESTLKALKKDIYTFAQSVDMENMDSFGNASGVALKYYYSGLEMNVNETEMYIKVGMQNFFNLFQLYLQLSGLLPKIEKNAVEVIFNHSMIQNTTEMIENAQKSKGIISDRTIVTNHPWVDDVDAEIQEMEKEIQI